MDGGSTDGTLEILQSYGDRLRYSSAKDKGPADAIHRGLLTTRGEILAWLNADDTLLPGAVRTAVAYLQAHPEIDIVYGEGYWVDEQGAQIRRYPSLPFDSRVLERDCFICQPASFFRASAYRRCGLDPDVFPSFDYDLWIRMALRGLRFAFIPGFLANSRIHGAAVTLREREKVFESSIGLLKRHYGYVPLSWVFGYAAYRIDGRDQFFRPLKPSLGKYFASLPLGLRLNAQRRPRFLAEWASAPFRGIWRRLRGGGI
jgi:glycosyltransferase involved in cell wall biosynthesis